MVMRRIQFVIYGISLTDNDRSFSPDRLTMNLKSGWLESGAGHIVVGGTSSTSTFNPRASSSPLKSPSFTSHTE